MTNLLTSCRFPASAKRFMLAFECACALKAPASCADKTRIAGGPPNIAIWRNMRRMLLPAGVIGRPADRCPEALRHDHVKWRPVVNAFRFFDTVAQDHADLAPAGGFSRSDRWAQLSVRFNPDPRLTAGFRLCRTKTGFSLKSGSLN